MANTGFKISPTLVQSFVTGPESGSLVSGTFGNFTTQLGVAPFSASLDDENYFYRIIDETVCPEGFEDCLAPLITNVITGSSKGLFNVNYTSPLSDNTAIEDFCRFRYPASSTSIVKVGAFAVEPSSTPK